ncbi:MAG: PEP-CTERM sorting domain-containing protein [Planctomycetota bacterium]
MKLSRFTLGMTIAVALLSSRADAELFMDNFNTVDSASAYVQTESSADTSVTYAFDYSALNIPVAPNTTDSSTLGVRFAANITGDQGGSGSAQAITLHTVQQFSGAYIVQFDAWINANGPFPGGGGGSTEFLTAGVGGDGLTPNRGGGTGSGGWTAVTGEGGASRDYRMYKQENEQFIASTQYTAPSQDAGNAYYNQFGNIDVEQFQQGPSQTGTTGSGTFGFDWHVVELVVDPAGQGTMTWSIDGLEIGTLNGAVGDDFATDGSVTIGYMDVFSSISDSPTNSFGLIDNLVVTAVPEPGSFALLTGLVVSATALRRRRRA